jgi:hypothetical protein
MKVPRPLFVALLLACSRIRRSGLRNSRHRLSTPRLLSFRLLRAALKGVCADVALSVKYSSQFSQRASDGPESPTRASVRPVPAPSGKRGPSRQDRSPARRGRGQRPAPAHPRTLDLVYQVILPVNCCCRHTSHDGNHMGLSAPELVDLQALVRLFVERELAPLERAVDDTGSDLGGLRTRGVERDGRWVPDARIATSRAKLSRHRDSEFRLPATCSAALAGVLAATAAVYRVHMLYFERFAARNHCRATSAVVGGPEVEKDAIFWSDSRRGGPLRRPQ